MYKNYYFDLYGTLMSVETNEETDMVWEKMALYYGYYGANYDAYELQSKYQKATTKLLNSNQVSHPEIDIQDVFYKLFKDKDIKLKKKMAKDAARVFRMLTTNSLEVYEGVIDMLMALKNQKRNVFLLANAQNAYALYELRKGGIRKYFDEFFFSSDFGMLKPETSFFEAAFAKEDIKKKDSIIISADYTRDIVGAKAFGVDTLYINADGEHHDSATCTYEVKGRDYAKIINLIVK
ncbi:MAG: HAD family hydrolase [Firmicutes bacterium HGW-Firmicutes-1]|jgi:putative hydrolase of the HAD superfamily|nr:MAG: HAD family hydrolase [Firmicutes bacterium HGW-Firmicutes-1]